MRPWIHIYRGRCTEIRFGALNVQFGVTAWPFSFAMWRNSDYAKLAAFRWGRWLA